MRNTPRLTLAKRVPSRGFGLLVLLATGSDPAAATGTLYCTIDDRNLSFEILGNTSMDYGTIVGVQRGRLTLKPGGSVKGAAEFAVSRDNSFQQRDFANDLQLRSGSTIRTMLGRLFWPSSLRATRSAKNMLAATYCNSSAPAEPRPLTGRARCEGD